MHIIVLFAVIVNIMSIITLLTGLLCNLKQPKIKAAYGYTIAANFLLYIILLCIVAIFELIVNYNLYSIILLLCAISPFIIGKLVKYETLKIYTYVQVMFFAISLATLLIKIY